MTKQEQMEAIINQESEIKEKAKAIKDNIKSSLLSFTVVVLDHVQNKVNNKSLTPLEELRLSVKEETIEEDNTKEEQMNKDIKKLKKSGQFNDHEILVYVERKYQV